MTSLRMLKIGDGCFAVFSGGVSAGRVERDRSLRLWKAFPLDGGVGVFRSKRAAAEWLATGHGHCHSV